MFWNDSRHFDVDVIIPDREDLHDESHPLP